eukprot:sb/3461448/
MSSAELGMSGTKPLERNAHSATTPYSLAPLRVLGMGEGSISGHVISPPFAIHPSSLPQNSQKDRNFQFITINLFRFRSLTILERAHPWLPPPHHPSSISYFLFTSGTTGKQPIRTRYLDHVTGYQPIRDQHFLIHLILPQQGQPKQSWLCLGFPGTTAQEIRTLLKGAELINHYGSTEGIMVMFSREIQFVGRRNTHILRNTLLLKVDTEDAVVRRFGHCVESNSQGLLVKRCSRFYSSNSYVGIQKDTRTITDVQRDGDRFESTGDIMHDDGTGRLSFVRRTGDNFRAKRANKMRDYFCTGDQGWVTKIRDPATRFIATVTLEGRCHENVISSNVINAFYYFVGIGDTAGSGVTQAEYAYNRDTARQCTMGAIRTHIRESLRDADYLMLTVDMLRGLCGEGCAAEGIVDLMQGVVERRKMREKKRDRIIEEERKKKRDRMREEIMEMDKRGAPSRNQELILQEMQQEKRVKRQYDQEMGSRVKRQYDQETMLALISAFVKPGSIQVFLDLAYEAEEQLGVNNWRNINLEILVPDWLITSHVTQITSSDWLFTCYLGDAKEGMFGVSGRVSWVRSRGGDRPGGDWQWSGKFRNRPNQKILVPDWLKTSHLGQSFLFVTVRLHDILLQMVLVSDNILIPLGNSLIFTNPNLLRYLVDQPEVLGQSFLFVTVRLHDILLQMVLVSDNILIPLGNSLIFTNPNLLRYLVDQPEVFSSSFDVGIVITTVICQFLVIPVDNVGANTVQEILGVGHNHETPGGGVLELGVGHYHQTPGRGWNRPTQVNNQSEPVLGHVTGYQPIRDQYFPISHYINPLTHGTELLSSLLQEDSLCIYVHNRLKSSLVGGINLPLQEENIHVLRNGELPLSWGSPVNRGLTVPTGGKEPTDTSKQPIRTRHLGHVTGYQPIRDQYFPISHYINPLTHGTELLSSLLQEDSLCIYVHNRLKSSLVGGINLPLQEENIHVLRNGELPLSWGEEDIDVLRNGELPLSWRVGAGAREVSEGPGWVLGCSNLPLQEEDIDVLRNGELPLSWRVGAGAREVSEGPGWVLGCSNLPLQEEDIYVLRVLERGVRVGVR